MQLRPRLRAARKTSTYLADAAFEIGLYITRRHQSHCVTKRLKPQGGRRAKNSDSFARLTRLRIATSPSRSTASLANANSWLSMSVTMMWRGYQERALSLSGCTQ